MIFRSTSAKLSARVHLLRTLPFPSIRVFTQLIFSVRIAKDLRGPQIYAVKFIDKISALNGHDPKSRKGAAILHQISSEVALHRTCSEHRNVIGFVATTETPIWRWIAMEFAEGGDLFDKIGKTDSDTTTDHFFDRPRCWC
jgi:serine/threonine protein kinase